MAPIRGHLRSRGYAYVEFKDQEAADKAWVTLHGEKLDGRKIFVLSHCNTNNRLRTVSRSPDRRRWIWRSTSRDRSSPHGRRSSRPWARPRYRSRSPLGRRFSSRSYRSPASSESSRSTRSSSSTTSSGRSHERSRSTTSGSRSLSSSDSNASDYSSRSSRRRYRSPSRESYYYARGPIINRSPMRGGRRNPYRLPRRLLPWRISMTLSTPSSGSTTSGYDSSLGSDSV